MKILTVLKNNKEEKIILTECEKSDLINGVLTVPEGVTHIGTNAVAVAHYEKIENVRLPKTIKEIGAGAFECLKIGTINLPEGIEKINEVAFADTEFDKKVFLPSNLKVIESNTFLYSKFKNGISLPRNLIEIKNGAFSNTKLETISLPKNLKIIGKDAFKGSTLTKIRIPDNVKIIREDAFSNTSLEQVTISTTLFEQQLSNNGYSFKNNKNLVFNISDDKEKLIPKRKRKSK